MSRRYLFFSLIVVVLLGAWGIKQLAHGIPLETNLLRLLPTTEANPIAEQALEHLNQAVGDRVLFLIGLSDQKQAIAAARDFATALGKYPAFKSVRAEIPAANIEQLQAPYLAARPYLLSEDDREALKHNPTLALQQRLQQRLNSILTTSIGLKIEDDPFDYFGRFLANLPWQNLHLQMQHGVLMVQQENTTWVWVLANLQGSAFDAMLQDQVVKAVANEEANLKQHWPAIQLLRTGSIFYAQAARASAQHDVELIGTIAVAGIAVLLLLAFRTALPLVLVAVSVAMGLWVALLITLEWFGSLHLLTLVFGASLIGEAVDYAIQICSIHAGQTLAAREKKSMKQMAVVYRSMWPSLLVALVTSVLGYLVLFFTPFPALNQIALFACSGLIAAFLVVRFWLPLGLQYIAPGRAAVMIELCQRSLHFLQKIATPRRAWLLCGLVLMLAIPGWFRMQANDDIRLLSTRPAVLVQQEQQLRQLVGIQADTRFFLVQARTEQALLEKEEALRDLLNPLIQQNQLTGVIALSGFVPSLQRQQENYDLFAQAGMHDSKKMSELLSQYGFNDQVAPHLVRNLAQKTKPLILEQWFAAPISLPYRHLWVGKTDQGFASLVIPHGIQSIMALQAIHLPGVTWVDKAESVSRLFSFYRFAGVLGLILMVVALFIVLIWRYGIRGSLQVLLPTLVALIVAPTLLGYLNIPLTLFAILALFLVLGVGVNYSIFLLDGSRLAKQPQNRGTAYGGANFLGVMLSSLTTLLSFGLLAFSSVPVLKQFGLVLASGILIAVLLAPTTLAWGLHYQKRNKS